MEMERTGVLSEDSARLIESEPAPTARSNVRELRERKNARRTMEQQTAASRDRGQKKSISAKEVSDKLAESGVQGENWMKELKPEEIRVLGEIIREYLG